MQLEAILDHIPGLVFFKDKSNRFIRVNRYLAEAHHKDKKDLEGFSLYDLYPHDEAERYYQDDLLVLNSGHPRLNIEERWETAEGSRWVSTSKIPLLDDIGATIGIIGISIDITERKHADQLIQDLIKRLEQEKASAQQNSITDGLTGLFNRRHFDAALKVEFSRARRYHNWLALIMLDIDHFKDFNDHYGHLAGDDCLRMVSNALRATIRRAPDILARYGGEEFVVILPDTDIDGAMILAERLRKAVEAIDFTQLAPGLQTRVTVSAGVAAVQADEAGSPQGVIERADKALYAAKRSGRNRCVEFIVAGSYTGPELGGTAGFLRLVWKASDMCGNTVIDRQHRRLYALSNKLLMTELAQTDASAALDALDLLLDEIVIHFHDEEQLLASVGYPEAADHARIHGTLLAEATNLRDRMQAGTATLGDTFDFVAHDMIAGHMYQEDRKFFPFFKSRKG